MARPTTESVASGPRSHHAGELAERQLTGMLHVFVAFDWGEEINLDQARSLVPAEIRELPRRRRTPASISYRPRPLRYLLAPPTVDLPELGSVQPTTEATLFDFAAVSVASRVPFEKSRTPPMA